MGLWQGRMWGKSQSFGEPLSISSSSWIQSCLAVGLRCFGQGHKDVLNALTVRAQAALGGLQMNKV